MGSHRESIDEIDHIGARLLDLCADLEGYAGAFESLSIGLAAIEDDDVLREQTEVLVSPRGRSVVDLTEEMGDLVQDLLLYRPVLLHRLKPSDLRSAIDEVQYPLDAIANLLDEIADEVARTGEGENFETQGRPELQVAIAACHEYRAALDQLIPKQLLNLVGPIITPVDDLNLRIRECGHQIFSNGMKTWFTVDMARGATTPSRIRVFPVDEMGKILDSGLYNGIVKAGHIIEFWFGDVDGNLVKGYLLQRE